MTALRLVFLIAATALAGCGEDDDRTSITLLSREISYDRSYFSAYPKVAEVHNAPFDGMTPADVAAALHLPSSYGETGGFALTAPGGPDRPKVRLAMAFNNRAPIPASALCAATTPLGASTPLDRESFMVDLALCRDDDVIASASMTARAGATRDAAFAERSLNHLMTALFGNHAEREQWER